MYPLQRSCKLQVVAGSSAWQYKHPWKRRYKAGRQSLLAAAAKEHTDAAG